MKQRSIRRFSIIFFCALLFVELFSACGSGSGGKDVEVSQISQDVNKALGKTDELVSAPDSYIQGYMKVDASQFGDYIVAINAVGANIDEYGIFKAGNLSAKEIREAVDNYLALRLSAWMEEYMPEEKPKLTGAEVKTEGDYVMYCILSDADKKIAFDAFEKALH